MYRWVNLLRYLTFFYECYEKKILHLFLFLFVAKKLFPCFPCYAALELLFSSASYYPMQGKQHVLNFLLNVFYSLLYNLSVLPTKWLTTIYMIKSVGYHFGQMVRKIQDW